jgi:serine protease SohB
MRCLLLVVALLSICQAKIIPLASTVTARWTLAASNRSSNTTQVGNTKDDVKSNGKERKSSMSIPKLWGRQQGKNESQSMAVGDKTDKGSDDIDTAGGKSATKLVEDGIEDEDVESSSDIDRIAETTETDGLSQSQSTENDQGNEIERREAEPQSTNQTQTRPGIVYMNIAPPTGPMVIPRPMYPYTPQQSHPPNKSSSLLSSIITALFPRPQNMPPVSPFGPPPMQPSSPYAPGGGNNPIVSLVLRLALISLGTLLLDVLGLGSQSDAFIPSPAQHYTFERVNDRYRRDRSALSQALESPPPGIGKHRWRRTFWRRRREVLSSLALAEQSSDSVVESPTLANGALYNRTVIIVDMKPDSRVGHGMAEHLRDSVSFIIEQHRDNLGKRSHAEKAYSFKHQLQSFLISRSSIASPSHNNRTPEGLRPALGNELEIVVFLDSPGGTVQDYGLASSQLARLRDEPQITLSVCVDRIAASGGYMMACQATPGHLFAAPFAMIGSIGVLMETVNVNEVLKRYGVNPLVIKAGKNKAPLKTLGEVTSEELQMAQDDADVIHEAFQQWVVGSRPNVVASQDWIDKVCTGAVFLGKEARELGLVDRILTSDEYVAEKIAAGDRVLRLLPYKGPQFGMKISPLDLLLSSMDAEGKLTKVRDVCMRIIQSAAPLFRVGAAVGVLNHLASLQSPYRCYTWAA